MMLPEWWPGISAWIPALTTTTVLGAIGAAIGPYYRAKVENRVRHDFDKQIEGVRSKLRLDEEAYKADLRARDEQIAALRASALSGLASRHASLDKRRLEAAEKLWSSMVDAAPLKIVSALSRGMRMDKILEVAGSRSADSAKMQQFVEFLWESHNLDSIKNLGRPDKERPFLTPLTWALYSAYMQMLHYPYVQLALARAGGGPDSMNGPDKLIDLIASILPDKKPALTEMGVECFPFLAEDFEQKILAELISSLYGEDADQRNIEQAYKIMGYIDGVQTADILNISADQIPEQARRYSS